MKLHLAGLLRRSYTPGENPHEAHAAVLGLAGPLELVLLHSGGAR